MHSQSLFHGCNTSRRHAGVCLPRCFYVDKLKIKNTVEFGLPKRDVFSVSGIERLFSSDASKIVNLGGFIPIISDLDRWEGCYW